MNWLTSIFSRRLRAAPRPSATQLYLERLENRLVPATANIVACEISGTGVWRWEGGAGWQQLTASDALGFNTCYAPAGPQIGLTSNGSVAAEISGYRVWLFTDGAGWQQLTPSDASVIASA